MRRVKVKEERRGYGGGLAFPPCFCYLITYASQKPLHHYPRNAAPILRSYCATVVYIARPTYIHKHYNNITSYFAGEFHPSIGRRRWPGGWWLFPRVFCFSLVHPPTHPQPPKTDLRRPPPHSTRVLFRTPLQQLSTPSFCRLPSYTIHRAHARTLPPPHTPRLYHPRPQRCRLRNRLQTFPHFGTYTGVTV